MDLLFKALKTNINVSILSVVYSHRHFYWPVKQGMCIRLHLLPRLVLRLPLLEPSLGTLKSTLSQTFYQRSRFWSKPQNHWARGKLWSDQASKCNGSWTYCECWFCLQTIDEKNYSTCMLLLKGATLGVRCVKHFLRVAALLEKGYMNQSRETRR